MGTAAASAPAPVPPVRSAGAVAEDLAACRARDAALVDQLAAAEATAAERRDAIGAAVAVGDDVRALRAQLRDAEDEVDGLTRGRAVLARTQATLEAEHAAARRRDTAAAADRAVDEAVAAAEALAGAVDRFVLDTFGPLSAAVKATGAVARDAETAADRARGQSRPGLGAVYERFWHGRGALETLFAVLDGHHAALSAGAAAPASAAGVPNA